MEPVTDVSIEMKEREVQENEEGQSDFNKNGEMKPLVTEGPTKFYFDKRETEEKYNKIVDIFKVQESSADEPDSGAQEISMERLKFVIKCLHKTKNPFHSFMNVLTVKMGNYKSLMEELDRIPRRRPDFLSLDEFSEYTAMKEKEETKMEWWLCCDGDEPPKGTLIDYFFGIANAQKVKMKPSAILFPLFALLLVAFHIAEPYLDLKSLLQFDMKAIPGHLCVNLALFLILGTGLHLTNKAVVLLTIYLLGVTSGSLAYYVFDAGGRQLVGCSGGVYCLVGASLSHCLMNWQEDRVVLFRYCRARSPLAFCGRMLQIIRLTTILVIAGVSVVTHIFGFLSGVEVGAMLLRDEIEEVAVVSPIMVDMPWERTVKTILWTFFCLGFGAAFGINIVGAANFQGFWHQNFWDPDQVLFNMTSSCT